MSSSRETQPRAQAKAGAVAGVWMRCWHEPNVTQLFTDLVANWAVWAPPASQVSFPIIVVLLLWWPLSSFLPPVGHWKAVVGQGVALKGHSLEKELYTLVGERLTEQMSSWKCCSLCDSLSCAVGWRRDYSFPLRVIGSHTATKRTPMRSGRTRCDLLLSSFALLFYLH